MRVIVQNLGMNIHFWVQPNTVGSLTFDEIPSPWRNVNKTLVLFNSRVITDKGDPQFIEVASGGQSLDPSLLDKTDGRLDYASCTHPLLFQHKLIIHHFKDPLS